jgi:hypothetical protein
MIFYCFENTDKTNRFDSDWCTRQKQYKNRNIIIITNKESLLYHDHHHHHDDDDVERRKESYMYVEEMDPTAQKTCLV